MRNGGFQKVVCVALAVVVGFCGGERATIRASAKTDKIVLNAKKKTVQLNKSFQLKVTCSKKNQKKLKWISSKKSIVNIIPGTNGKAKVKAKKTGKTKITVKIKGTSLKAVCQVTVKDVSAVTTTAPSQEDSEITKTPETAKETSSPGSTKDPGSTGSPGITSSPGSTAQPGETTPSESGTPSGDISSGSTSQSGSTTSSEGTAQSGGAMQSQQGSDGNATQSPADPSSSLSPSQGTDDPADGPTALSYTVCVASKQLVTDGDGNILTAYVINKKFYGNFTIRLNDHSYTTKTSGRSVITLLAGQTASRENSEGTIRVSRSTKDENWKIEDLSNQKTYYMWAEKTNPIAPEWDDCGVIYIQGDVGSEVEITGQAVVEE